MGGNLEMMAPHLLPAKVRLLPLWIFLAGSLGGVRAQSTALPAATSSLFQGSGGCAFCHQSNGTALVDGQGNDLSLATFWRSSLMANAARDPYWQAKVESEVAEHPALKDVIEDKCTTCHTPMGRTQAVHDGAAGYSLDEARQSSLAMDGVSCTLCHQIQPEGLGTEASFSGGYVIDDSRIIFGPYPDPVAGPMQAFNFTPAFGAHLQGAELCASCHTLFTPYLDDDGNVAGTFPEQVAFFEWQNSDHSRAGTQCQDCHMPRIEDPVIVASVPANMPAHSPFWQHHFVGGNVFMLKMLRDQGSALEVTATAEQFDRTLLLTRNQLRQSTARLSLNSRVDAGNLQLDVTVENLAGHKFPTGFPSRRAWLHVKISNATGNVVFESGAFNSDGEIQNHAEGVEPHHDLIEHPDQVQIYESVMGDVNGEPTDTLLRGARYLKDNRLPPSGFTSTAQHYDVMAIQGAATQDSDFNHNNDQEGSGTDIVHYSIPVSGQSGLLTVQVDLLYQAINPKFLNGLFRHDLPAVNQFKTWFEQADQTPELVHSQVQEIDLSGARPEITTYEEWRFFFFPDAAEQDAVSGPEADPDQDGVRNRSEYALWLDPRVRDTTALPAFSLIEVGGDRFLGVTLTRTDAADVDVRVEVSPDLIHWESGPDFTEILSRIPQPGAEKLTIRDKLPVASTPFRFMRIQISEP